MHTKLDLFGFEPVCWPCSWSLDETPNQCVETSPLLPLIQYCLCLLQSIACNLGHGRLRVTAVIMRKPHNCNFACFSCFHLIWECRLWCGLRKISNVSGSWGSFKANRPTWKTHCQHAKTEAVSLSCWKVDILEVQGFYPEAMIYYPAVEAWCVNENIWPYSNSVCVCLWTDARSCTQWHKLTQSLPDLLVYETPPYKFPQWSHSTQGAAGASAPHQQRPSASVKPF